MTCMYFWFILHTMLLSVIIVNYNVKYFLEQCLCSVRKAIGEMSIATGERNVEVWVVDNNSTDGSIWYCLLDDKFQQFYYVPGKHIRLIPDSELAPLSPEVPAEQKRIEVVGTDSPYTVDTYGRPRRIVIDPNDWVLKNSSDVKVRTAIMRGQGFVRQGDLTQALTEFQKALDLNKNSSLAHYRIAEVFFLQHNYQAAANAYREAESGDLDPKWVEVWSHIRLGNIFDLTGQRERATNEYRQALQTNDNTQGALEEARKYLQAPYQQKPSSGQ